MHGTTGLFRFSLGRVAPDRRADTLREFFGRGIVNMEFQPLTDDPRMDVEIRLLPGVAITRGVNSPHLADSGHDPSRENDDFALVWGTAPGKGRLRHLGRESVGDDGAAAFISCADRVTAETRTLFHHQTVRISRALLLPLLPRAEAALMRPIAPDNTALRLLTGYLETLRGLRQPAPDLAQAIAAHIADLVALAVGASRDARALAGARGGAAARLATLKQWILARLDDPALDIRSVARAEHLHPRYIQRLFEAEGTTFTRFVLTQRLALAHRRLSSLACSGLTISAIAFACGFGDVSHFNHSFRAAYGETPGDVRHRMQRSVR